MMQLTFDTFETLKEEVAAKGIIARDYQQRAIGKCFELWDKGKPGCIVRQPTGTGKTIVGSLVADQWLGRSKNHRVIVLCHERQLVHQFAAEVEDVLGEAPGIEMAKEAVPANKIPKITVASRATLYERTVETESGETEQASRLYKFDTHRYIYLVILDEVHRYLWKLKSCRHILEWFQQNPESRRLGLTATPMRGDKRSLRRVVPAVAADYPLYDINGGPCAVDDGWAVPYDQRFVTVEGVDFSTIKEVAKDFDPHELEAVMKERETLLSMVKPTLDIVGDDRTLIFNPTVNMAKWVAHTINEFKPDQAESINGTTPEHVRADTYRRHQAGEFQFLSVCSLCREGYNDPGIGAVAIFRPTKSRGLAEQMKGRGCRPLRGLVDGLGTPEERRAAIANSSKASCKIVDLVGVTGLADCVSTAHLLAEGLPDEVIDRANKNALEKDGPLDMGEEVRQAKKEIDEEEREKARLAREEKERKEKEQAARLSRFGGEVRYSQTRVRQGQGSRVYSPGRRAYMPFGKFKGQPVAELPKWYLESLANKDWCKTKWIKQAARQALNGNGKLKEHAGKEHAGPANDNQKRVLVRLGKPADVSYAEAAAMISEAYPAKAPY